MEVSEKKSDLLALGEAELDFAVELLTWLCHRRIIGSITMRNAMLEVRKFNPACPAKPPGRSEESSAGPRRSA